MSRRRDLTPEDWTLWRHVAQAVRPLPGRTMPPEPAPAHSPPANPKDKVPAPQASTLEARKAGRQEPAPPPLAPLERRLRSRLERGREPIEAVLDLHGLTQDQAHAALLDFLHRSQRRGARLVLLVTGKGRPAEAQAPFADPACERGVLRRMVPHWLRRADLHGLVLGFEEAGLRHGGSGALYVRLRRSGPDKGEAGR